MSYTSWQCCSVDEELIEEEWMSTFLMREVSNIFLNACSLVSGLISCLESSLLLWVLPRHGFFFLYDLYPVKTILLYKKTITKCQTNDIFPMGCHSRCFLICYKVQTNSFFKEIGPSRNPSSRGLFRGFLLTTVTNHSNLNKTEWLFRIITLYVLEARIVTVVIVTVTFKKILALISSST